MALGEGLLVVPFDVTVIINCNSEGRLLHPTMKSVGEAVSCAEANGITVEWLIAANNPTSDLKSYLAENAPESALITELDESHLGAARNQSIELANGKWIALVDGAHLWSENWLISAIRKADLSDKSIMHAEVKVFFEKEVFFARNVDQESTEFSTEALFEHNYWNASSFALKSTYQKVPFICDSREARPEFIDWHWSCETVAAGMLHKVVPETIHAIRLDTWKTSNPAVPDIKHSGTIATSLFDMGFKTRR
jgi:hypothetical protein